MIPFNLAYNYYVLLLELSSAGIPLTISKLVSKYNEEGNYAKSKRIAKTGSVILMITGAIGFAFFFYYSDFLAASTLKANPANLYFSVEEVSLVIKTLSLAVPFVMLSSGFRGVFQGHEIMTPSAVSQFLEQLFRILAMLIGAYIVMEITNGNIVYANAVATLATSVGAIVAIIVLFYYYKKYYKNLEFNKNNTKNETRESLFKIIKEILLVSFPFMIVSSFFAILSIIDQNTIIGAMDELGKAKIGDSEFNLYNNLINKIVMIAVALAPAFTGAFLPAITRLYVNRNLVELSKQINKVVLALLMIVIPALVAMFILAEPLYISFYEPKHRSFELMRVYLPLALLYSIYGMTGIIMQAIDKQKLNVVIIIIGLSFKYIFNTPFILRFETEGAIYCSILTYILMIFLNIVVINLEVKLKIKQFAYNLLKICLASFIMFILVAAIYDATSANFNIYNKFDSLILLIISGIFGAPLYFFVLQKIKFINYLFGREVSLKTFLRRK